MSLRKLRPLSHSLLARRYPPTQLTIPSLAMSTATPANGQPDGQAKPLDILLIGLGSIGSVYAHILERVGHASPNPMSHIPN